MTLRLARMFWAVARVVCEVSGVGGGVICEGFWGAFGEGL